jgi:hypothetical protein
MRCDAALAGFGAHCFEGICHPSHQGFQCFFLMLVDCVWNVMAHARKPHFVFRQNGRVHWNQWGCQFSRLLLAAEVCASAVVMLDTPCSEVVWRILATLSIHQFPLHFRSCASPCAITFQLDSNHLHSIAMSHPVRPESVIILLWKIQNSHNTNLNCHSGLPSKVHG